MRPDRERDVAQAFVSLTTNLVDGFDVVELLSGLTIDCTQLLDVAAAGLLLADARGRLQVAAASSEALRHLELVQLQRDDGPCLDCYHSGTAVSVPYLRSETARWPQFVPAALNAGFESLHAVPMRLQDHILGALGLFGATSGALHDDDLALAQALAHVASVSIVTSQATADRELITDQLQMALNSRVVLEQAKGIISQLGALDMDDAFACMRSYSRAHNRRLTDVAQDVVDRDIPAGEIVARHTIRSAGSRASS